MSGSKLSGCTEFSSAADLLDDVKLIAKDAGDLLMAFYKAAKHNPDALGKETKADDSPVTIADKQSSELIETRLALLTPGIAVMSEENDFVPSDKDDLYWAVDPLDGTKLFIDQTDGFAVNIALIKNGSPVLGVVYSPALNEMYFSAEGLDSYKFSNGQTQKIHTAQSHKKGDLKTHFDQAHADPSIYRAQRKRIENTTQVSLPLYPDVVRLQPSNMLVATGKYDLHVKTGIDESLTQSAGYIWDNAADYIILKNAGGRMIDMTTGEDLKFNQGRQKQPAYITFGSRDLAAAIYPKAAYKHKPK